MSDDTCVVQTDEVILSAASNVPSLVYEERDSRVSYSAKQEFCI